MKLSSLSSSKLSDGIALPHSKPAGLMDKLLSSRKVRDNVSLFLFLLPTLVFVFVFIAFPVLFSGYLSLTRYNFAVDAPPAFVGLTGYYNTLVNDSFFHTALYNQLRFALAYSMISFTVSLGLAILVGELNRGAEWLQVTFYLPIIIPLSMVGITFSWILSPDLGIFNYALTSMGLENWTRDWFGDPDTALYALVMADAWKAIGFTFIIFLSGLNGIPRAIREAAKVDGAGFFQEIYYIVIPLLRPYLLTGAIWITINSLKVFDLPQTVTQGGPGVATLTLYLYSWKAAFQRFDMGLASQVAYLTAFIILFISWILHKVLNPSAAERY